MNKFLSVNEFLLCKVLFGFELLQFIFHEQTIFKLQFCNSFLSGFCSLYIELLLLLDVLCMLSWK